MVIERVDLESLNADSGNARAHGEKNMAAIRGSLAKFGQVEPLVVQKSSNTVIGGNGRLAAMRELGWSDCDVVYADVDNTQAAALAQDQPGTIAL